MDNDNPGILCYNKNARTGRKRLKLGESSIWIYMKFPARDRWIL